MLLAVNSFAPEIPRAPKRSLRSMTALPLLSTGVRAALLFLILGASLWRAGDCLAADERVRVAVYRGAAACEDCAEAVKAAFARLGKRYEVAYLGPDEASDVTPASLSTYDIYVQPGGGQDIPGALRALGASRVAAIKQYVVNGGRYLGLCMGAHLADASGIALIPQVLDAEAGRPNFPVKTIDDAVVRVVWQGVPEYVFFQDGPFLPENKWDQRFKVIARYQNGDIAVARYSHGAGLMVLSGPHPEAGDAWFEDIDADPAQRPSRPLFKDLVQHLGR
ncbi:BPL-N domain-containing protein [Mitsuaria sp. GD03876]|uniref:BPL-N domain-containing protein n=1 Tax=Mitsuaria sp. GD03876 TaxID=2975399 RepID=UPI002448C506|nr:BPL-N domain-containing protein [Mitsuaria sp. GD03876]MDH0867539.1 BPL-N domain-containing protein [Mitsuaria sp. GD03876]